MAGLSLAHPGDRSARALRLSGALAVLLVLASAAALGLGASGLSLAAVIRDLLAGQGMAPRDQVILMQIRLPRLGLGLLIGAGLGVSGALMQGLFRNPLADPGLVGVGAGAGLGAVLVIVLGGLIGWQSPLAVPLAAFAGAGAAVLILYRVATRGGRTSVAVLLLAPRLGAGLNALALGEAAARHIGHPVQRIKALTVLAVAAATGAATAAAGGIGFVGIVVPHLLRLASGPDHRRLLPNAALLGAALLVAADTAARLVVAPAELPIGIITALLGAPVFLWILLRQAGHGEAA